MNAKDCLLWLVVMGVLLATGCQTTVLRDGVEVPEESQDENRETSADRLEKQMVSVIRSVGYDRGSDLLRDLQWLIAQRQFAVPHIVEALPRADDRTRANLLYVLGFARTDESTRALAEYLGSQDDAVRFEAAAGLLSHGDSSSIPVLVQFLKSGDKRLRYKAIQTLRESTGRDFGFKFAAPEELRTASVVQWERWWDDEKERLMYRPWQRGETPASER